LVPPLKNLTISSRHNIQVGTIYKRDEHMTGRAHAELSSRTPLPLVPREHL
jgi:hypothetical protein